MPRCDRCRVEYSSGCDYGGHDYCMTCYLQLRQQEEKKRRDAELKLQKEAQTKRAIATERYMARDEERKREIHDEMRRRGMMNEIKERQERERKQAEERRKEYARREEERKAESAQIAYGAQRKSDEEEMRKRRRWETHKRKEEIEGGAISLDIQKKAARSRYSPSVRTFEIDEGGGDALGFREIRIDDGSGKKKPEENAAQITLSAAAGLPVSLSIGQKDIRVSLIGKNASIRRINVELFASAFDSKKKPIDMKAEPKKCYIDADGEQKFEITLDLSEEAAKGEMLLDAYLKENAFFIDGDAGRSDPVMMHSQVKTPMDLQYRAKSAAISEFEGAAALVLEFDNKGESGGLVSKKSKAICTTEGDAPYDCQLCKETKVKGMQKKVQLAFALSGKAAMPGKIGLMLIGVDSNGKPYSKKQEIKAKEGKGNPLPEEGGKEDSKGKADAEEKS